MNEFITEASLDHNPDPHSICIGSILFSEIVEEKEIVGKSRFNTNGIGECKIEVFEGEGDLPHFHLSNSDKTFSTCICIYSNNYFSHGGKYTGTLSSKQRKELNSWLKSDSKVAGFTNWDLTRATWEQFNSGCNFPENEKVINQPHYENMTQYKNL